MKKTFTLSFLVSIILPICLLSCSHASHNQPQAPDILQKGNSQVLDKKGQVWQQVTVNYYNFEGGFYGLTSKAGDKLLPINLSKQYKLPGTVLKVKGEIIKGMMTIQQWGQPFKITDVELIKLGQNAESNKEAKY